MLEAQGSSRALLSRSDQVYLLSLLIPFVLYDLSLKAALIASQSEDFGFVEGLGLMRSDIFFNLGYALLWVVLFAVARGRPYRSVVVFLFHTATMFVALVTMSAYQYFKVTGSMLDLDFILFSVSSSEGLGDVVASEVSPGLLILILAILAYAVLGPWLIVRLVGRYRGWPEAADARAIKVPWFRVAAAGLATYALFSLSLLPGGGGSIGGPSKSFSRDSFVNVAMAAAEEVGSGELSGTAADRAAGEPPPEASLRATAGAERRNVVLVHLESTRAQSTTPYSLDLQTTPYMDELAQKSLLAEKAYAIVPHTTNALAATNCGMDPPLNPWQTSSLGDRVPYQCLAHLLKEQGYDTVWFTSSVSTFEVERLPELVENLGYEEFYPVETMNTEGFEKANYFGYEDDVMLEPSKEWLEENGEEPFLVKYLTGTGHDDYKCLSTRYGKEDFADEEPLNSYLNCLRYQDFFVKNLIDQYKELGLYEETIFVIYGDHGEGFGEHRRYQHDDTMWEEGLKVPFLIHAPGLFKEGERVKGLSNQTDILPTVLDMLGYEVKDGEYPGYSLLHQLPEDRTLMFSCFHDKACMASLKGDEKYIYHHGNQPDEFFDLSEDPLEKENLAGEESKEIEERREALLEWRSSVNATY